VDVEVAEEVEEAASEWKPRLKDEAAVETANFMRNEFCDSAELKYLKLKKWSHCLCEAVERWWKKT
jgi:hypothetical protein